MPMLTSYTTKPFGLLRYYTNYCTTCCNPCPKFPRFHHLMILGAQLDNLGQLVPDIVDAEKEKKAKGQRLQVIPIISHSFISQQVDGRRLDASCLTPHTLCLVPHPTCTLYAVKSTEVSSFEVFWSSGCSLARVLQQCLRVQAFAHV